MGFTQASASPQDQLTYMTKLTKVFSVALLVSRWLSSLMGVAIKN